MISITQKQIEKLIALEVALGERLTRQTAKAMIETFTRNRLPLHRDLSAILEWRAAELP